ncbi:hypothetical protein CEP54_002099 [Fusarium duplospermum]|uniref:Heterokaryon incompatibility domain-containing protein n=1 Tax=Fusarium duplospermum TaxID=1325734 RepID=A0A428QWK4_9HYPO|nr:hypothetical protein CEP54_002099 [Fusarium duplospermum]
MDIIPEPRDALHEILAPLAEPIVPYDGTDFSTFGEMSGLTFDKADAETPAKTTSILQSWLFFGLLSRALKDDFRTDDFIKPSQKDRFLSLKNLPSDIDVKDPEFGGQLLKDCMDAATFIRRLETLGGLESSPAGETGLAILVLAKALLTVAFRPSRQAAHTFAWSSTFLRKHMTGLGWCPQQVAWIMVSCDPISACFLARLRRSSRLSHGSCTEDACVANNVQLDSNYRQRHVRDDCACNSLAVDANKVKDIIRQGHIPLVSVKRSSRGEASLEVSSATSRSAYAAISHVWSDGLGNPTANAIPQCQAEMISESLSKISRGDESPCKSLFEKAPLTQFWLDTLCIPVSTPKDSPDTKADVDNLKLMAINQMGQIYAAASQILVLDSELQQVGSGTLDQMAHVESLTRLVSCAWMRRCWTLQEGALANKITFQSAVGPMTPFLPPRISDRSVAFGMLPGPFVYIRFYQLYKWARTHKKSVREREANPILADLRYRFQEILDNVTSTHNRSRFFGQATPASQLEVFSAVWNQLAYRNTTKKEDLPAIFSNLLDINVWKLLQHRPEDRMKALLRSTDALPIDLLFNTGPRALSGRDSLDRWVPSQPSRTSMRSSREAHDGEPDPVREFFDDYIKNSLRWTESGDLELSPLNSTEMMALMLGGGGARNVSCPALVTYIDVDQSGEGGEATPFLVRLYSPEVDELPRDDSRKEVLILDVRDRSGGGGCLLRLTTFGEEPHELVGRYDCPLTWESASPEDLASYPTISCVDFGNPFKLTIPCEAGPVMNGWAKRPLHGHLMGTAKLTGTLLMGIMKIFWLASFIVRIIIEVKLGWSNLSPLGRAATMTFVFESSGAFTILIPTALPQILFIIDRVQTAGSLSWMDIAYLVLRLLGHSWLHSCMVWLLGELTKPIMYKMWLDSFNPDWPEDANWSWRLCFWIGNKGYAVVRRLYDFGYGWYPLALVWLKPRKLRRAN